MSTRQESPVVTNKTLVEYETAPASPAFPFQGLIRHEICKSQLSECTQIPQTNTSAFSRATLIFLPFILIDNIQRRSSLHSKKEVRKIKYRHSLNCIICLFFH